MAGIEQLEIHSKSYILRWVKVDEGHTISWTVQPHKKSINFGIVKHPGTSATDLDDGQTDGSSDTKTGIFAKNDATTAPDQLRKKGFKLVKWHGKCEADKVSIGTYDVPPGSGGMYGLVFDNTFSKQISKNATFVLLTYPTGAPPQGAAHQLRNLQAGPNANNSGTSLGNLPSESADSLGSHNTPGASGAQPGGSGTGGSGAGGSGGAGAPYGSNGGAPSTLTALSSSSSANYHVGTLMKRRRKKGQGYARRYFSLDYGTCTLSYYHNRNSSALRGAIPLSLAAIAAEERRREISIDSGAEVWHLKASNAKEFSEWTQALEQASRLARGAEQGHTDAASIERAVADASGSKLPAIEIPTHTKGEDRREWQQVEALVSRVVGTRDALRRLVKDMDTATPHQQQSLFAKNGALGGPAASSSVFSEESDDALKAGQQAAERRSFWRRKSSAAQAFGAQNMGAPVASSLAVPTPSTASAITPLTPNGDGRGNLRVAKRHSRSTAHEERSMQDHCEALLTDLDSVVASFTKLLAKNKHRRTISIAAASMASPRKSYDSTSTTDEFFDAHEGMANDRSLHLLHIDRQSEADDTPATDVDDDEEPEVASDASSVSSGEDENEYGGDDGGADGLYPVKPKSLTPLPISDAVTRRATVRRPTVMPPSLIAFVRKNVGKDLSTISMPASANEPISLLQRMAEQLEYAQLLDTAAKQSRPIDRLAYVTAFAVSQFSSGRAKERAIRKPFNPLLGETYELLRSDKEVPGGMRVLVEKVTHRPVRVAMQADSANWSFAQSPAPSQKFWGKSAELTTEGRVRLVLRLPDGTEEKYSWVVATMFLRNVVMGEKYVEPVGTMHVVNDSTGAKAAIEFRSKGMFGGRGEDVQVELYDEHGGHAGTSLTGTWTASLKKVEGKSGGKEIWKVGQLVDDAARVYGMTRFAAALNEISALEKGKLAATDSRLRPDQRLAEDGQLDEAEVVKTRLEEAQRARRRQMEERGEEHKPRWFTKVEGTTADGDEVWRLKGGKDGYWEERARGTWTGVENIFE